MKSTIKKTFGIIALMAIFTIAFFSCPTGPTSPTVRLSPANVTVDNGNLSQTVIVGGTATGDITLNTSALPAGVTATVDDTTITITGVRPTADVPAITGSFTVAVTRQGVTQNLTVNVNLTTTWIPTLTLSTSSVTIDDDNLSQTVTVGGTTTGEITLSYPEGSLPSGVTAAVSGPAVIVTGVRPTTEGAAPITGTFTLAVTRQGVTENLTLDVYLTWTPTVILTPTSVTVNDSNLIPLISVDGTATGDITLSYPEGALPSGVIAYVFPDGGVLRVAVIGTRPTAEGAAPITGTFTVAVTRQDVTENLTVIVNLTTSYVAPTLTLSSTSVTVNNNNLTRTINVSGTATGDVTLSYPEDALPSGVTVAVSGTTITVTGVRPTTNVPAVTGSFTVAVTRQGITRDFTVNVNLTTTWVDITLSPTSVTINDSGSLDQSVSVGGSATGTVTLNTSALPDGVTAAVSGSTITVTGVRPATEGAPAITGTFTVVVTRHGVTENLTVNVNLTTTWTGPFLPIQMVPIEAGTFLRGSPNDEKGRYSNEGPQRTITISAFNMSAYQITQEQWAAVMEDNNNNISTTPSYFNGSSGRAPAAGEVQGKRPVENVSWYEAIVFANLLSMRENLDPAYSISGSTDPGDWGNVPTTLDSTWYAVTIVSGSTGYRLPTEAEWEYACRAGTTTAFNSGNNDWENQTALSPIGWFPFNSDSRTHEVGKKSANAWGLYDMHGNVSEWCWDGFATSYGTYTTTDPAVPATGNGRVHRGGSWYLEGRYARSAGRNSTWEYNIREDRGFRLVLP